MRCYLVQFIVSTYGIRGWQRHHWGTGHDGWTTLVPLDVVRSSLQSLRERHLPVCWGGIPSGAGCHEVLGLFVPVLALDAHGADDDQDHDQDDGQHDGSNDQGDQILFVQDRGFATVGHALFRYVERIAIMVELVFRRFFNNWL